MDEPFVRHAMLAGILVGGLCAFAGVYLLLRRMVFLGITLAQLASAGVAAALLVGWAPLPLAVVASVAGAVALTQRPGRGPLPPEAALGVAYVIASSIALVCIAKNPVGEARALSALFGTILAVPAGEMVAIAAAAALVGALHLAFRKELVFVAFDPETARAHGVRARLWELALALMLGVAIAVAIRAAGVLVTFALLVVPAVGARLAAATLAGTFVLATAIGTVAVPVGLLAALAWDLPTSAGVGLVVVVLAGAVVALRALSARRGLAAPVAGALAWIIALGAGALAPVAAQTGGAIERELAALRDAVGRLTGIVEQQQRLIDELRRGAAPGGGAASVPRPESAAPSPPAAARAAEPATSRPATAATPTGPSTARAPALPGAPAEVPASPRATVESDQTPRALPPWLALLPELRLEGNLIYNFTASRRRRTLERVLGEEEGGDEPFVRRNRVNVREVELGLRSAVDPYARFEAILSAEQTFGGDIEVGLEEAVLTLSALPGGVEAVLGRFRTKFGEFNDSDPEEIPEVTPPLVVQNLFGRQGDGWIDTGLAVTRRFGITDTFTLQPWLAIFNGDNDAAFHGGQAGVARRPAWYARLEGFHELAQGTGLEWGLGYAEGKARDDSDRATLRSRILNAHVQLEHREPVLFGLFQRVNAMAEAFYTLRDRFREPTEDEAAAGAVTRRETLGRFGMYALLDLPITRRWSVGGRFDYSELPTREADLGPSVRREVAGSFIVSFHPSRFLTLRGQYTHVDRNFAPSSDEFFLQTLFKLGYERPGPF